jgi:methyl-accepting chemotaxis protein
MTTNDSTLPTVGAKDGAEIGSRGSVAEFTQFFEIHALLRGLSDKTTDACQVSSAVITRQRSDVEALSEWLRRLETGLREARNHVDTLGVALDRIKIVALNAGLEGARLGDLAGKALIAVSDELRNLTTRGLELLSEQASTVEQMEADRQRLVVLSERSQSQLSELESKLREALSTEQLNHQALSRFAGALQAATGLDVEAAAHLSQISEQARGLVELLTGLSKPEHQRAVRSALLPALEPLVAWLLSSADPKP